MTRKLKTVAAVSVLGSLLGCALVSPVSPLDSKQGRQAVVVASLPSNAPSADTLYLMARAAHGQGQLEVAAQLYADVLQIAPRHLGALNAAAVIYAQKGRTDEALQWFKHAIEIAPGTAHLHNNAGYALLRAGRLAEAERELKLAQQLDPANPHTLQNLELWAEAKSRAAQASGRDDSVRQSIAEDSSGPRLVAVGPNVYELQARSSAQSAPQLANSAAAAAAPIRPAAITPVVNPLRGVRIEVSNGVGITNMARRVSLRLAPAGVITARLSNARPYRQMKTEIQYAAGQDLPAQALQARLPLAARAVASDRLQAGVQLRLVLGHDLAGKTMAAWPDSDGELSAGGANRGGWLWG